jgi:hypothetical protein
MIPLEIDEWRSPPIISGANIDELTMSESRVGTPEENKPSSPVIFDFDWKLIEAVQIVGKKIIEEINCNCKKETLMELLEKMNRISEVQYSIKYVICIRGILNKLLVMMLISAMED